MTVWWWWWWWCYTHGLTGSMKCTLCTEGFLPVRDREKEATMWNFPTTEEDKAEFTAFQRNCQCVRVWVCVCESRAAWLFPLAKCLFPLLLSPATRPLLSLKPQGKDKEEKTKSTWPHVKPNSPCRTPSPAMSAALTLTRIWTRVPLCYDVNKDLYGRYFEICTAKHFRPWGLMFLLFV